MTTDITNTAITEVYNQNKIKLDKICRACMIEKSGLKSLFEACVAEMWTVSTSILVS